MTKSRHILGKRTRWTPEELQILSLHYSDGANEEIAAFLGRQIYIVAQMANKIGLHKSAAWRADSKRSGRFNYLACAGEAYRFQKGTVPLNKGLRRPGYAPGRMAQTQFKKGRTPQESRNYIPIGGFRINADGHLDRKVCDQCIAQRRYMGHHRWVWMMANGPIPPGHVIRFKEGRSTTVAAAITIDAIECITMRENRWRNSIHQVMPPELKEITYLRRSITRTINRRIKDGEQHDPGTARTPVRHARRLAQSRKAHGHRARPGGR